MENAAAYVDCSETKGVGVIIFVCVPSSFYLKTTHWHLVVTDIVEQLLNGYFLT
jgi:hypothetical protein